MLNARQKLMSQETYQNHRSGLMFLFISIGVEIDETFKNDIKPFVEGIKKTETDKKVKAGGEEGKRKCHLTSYFFVNY